MKFELSSLEFSPTFQDEKKQQEIRNSFEQFFANAGIHDDIDDDKKKNKEKNSPLKKQNSNSNNKSTSPEEEAEEIEELNRGSWAVIESDQTKQQEQQMRTSLVHKKGNINVI